MNGEIPSLQDLIVLNWVQANSQGLGDHGDPLGQLMERWDRGPMSPVLRRAAYGRDSDGIEHNMGWEDVRWMPGAYNYEPLTDALINQPYRGGRNAEDNGTVGSAVVRGIARAAASLCAALQRMVGR